MASYNKKFLDKSDVTDSNFRLDEKFNTNSVDLVKAKLLYMDLLDELIDTLNEKAEAADTRSETKKKAILDKIEEEVPTEAAIQ